MNASVKITLSKSEPFTFTLFSLPVLAIHCFFFAHFLPQTGLSVWGSLGSYGPLTQKEAKAVCKFLLLWKGCSPGSHYFASVSGLAFLACSPTTVWVLWAAWLYNVIHSSPTCLHLCLTCLLLTCISHDVPGVPQQHPPSTQKNRLCQGAVVLLEPRNINIARMKSMNETWALGMVYATHKLVIYPDGLWLVLPHDIDIYHLYGQHISYYIYMQHIYIIYIHIMHYYIGYI